MSFCLYNKKNIYTEAWRYEFYFLVAKTIFYSLAELVRKILFCYSKIKFISSRQLSLYMSFGITVLTIMNQYSRIIETIRLRFFGISCESRRSRSHATRFLPSGLRFEVHVCTGRPRSRGKVCTLKHRNPTFEKKYDFLELFCLLIIEFYFQNVILKTISRLK